MSLTINKADMISSMPDRGNIGHSRHYTCRPILQWYFVTQQNCQGESFVGHFSYPRTPGTRLLLIGRVLVMKSIKQSK